jgi:hypothetical protein
MKIMTVGIDLAKNVFQVHGVNEHGKTVLRKQLKRDQVATFFAIMPQCDRYGGLWKRPPLGSQAARLGSRCEADGPAIRQTIRENEQKRCG